MLTTNRFRPRVNPWHVLDQVQQEFNKDLASWFGTAPAVAERGVGVWTKPGEAVIAAAFPGREMEDLQVSVHGDEVSLTAQPSNDSPPDGARVLREERVREAIERKVQLPFEVDKEKTSAVYQRGILVLRLAAVEASQPASIEIQAK